MVIVRTAEAELVGAGTSYRGHDAAEIAVFDGTVDSIDAVGSRAPSKVNLIVDIGSSEKSVIPRKTSSVSQIAVNAHKFATYRSIKSASFAKRSSSDFESTIKLQPSPGHWIRAASPSSLIFCAR